jgi:adenylate kinase
VSTGDAFRAAVKAESELGAMVQGYMDRGELVPDSTVVEVVREHLFGRDAPAGFVLDGFPRNVSQAEALAEMAGPRGIDLAVDLEVSTDEVVRRMAGRRVCRGCGANYNLVNSPSEVPGVCDACGGDLVQRDDDTEEAIRRRLEIYESDTAPLIDWYRERGLLAAIDAVGDPDEIASRVIGAVAGALRS